MFIDRSYYLPDFSEFRFFCFPHSVGNYRRPTRANHNVSRPDGVPGFSLHYVAQGRGFLELDGETHALRAGDMFWHAPEAPMRYYSADDDPWDVFWIQLYGSTLPSFVADNGFSQSGIWMMKDGTLLKHNFLDLLDEIEHRNFLRPARISALSYAILIEFLTHAVSTSHYRGVNNAETIMALLPIMQQKAHQPFVLEEWASSAGYSPNYFCSLFKKITRMTPVAYVTKCRIQLSKHLLLQRPLLPIKEVAISSGYPGLSYFNKKFMAAEGMTPGEFRNKHLSSM
ncbi:AraC family transcriptional regulator [Paenibacillus sp. IB182496]|uniref:AraC family transcriptional regulator n=1 Tax=Paenibacillus sabuli TaxID=2772509 RepID=A0A927GUF9_9BACL|nr:AraC family transcriptional regulator [Paenibacillus sabuli]MBD2848115.1 AraC family transcriptional regulator [Paenibacillus sabuli]